MTIQSWDSVSTPELTVQDHGRDVVEFRVTLASRVSVERRRPTPTSLYQHDAPAIIRHVMAGAERHFTLQMKDVMVVDDDDDFATTLGQLLETHGHRVTIAHSGEEALLQFQSRPFDAVILDVGLPGMSGIEVAMELRERRPDIVIMVATGYSLEREQDLSLQARKIGLLTKPFDPDRLLKLVGEGVINDPGPA